MRRMKWWLVVTGTGRCGTGYISQVLNSVGVKCSHEDIFAPYHTPEGPIIPEGLVTDDEIRDRMRTRLNNAWWGWQAESSWMAVPYLDLPEMEKMTIVHLVRDPKKTIDSMIRTGGFTEETGELFWQFQIKHLPELLETDDLLERAGLFYTRWNARIEPYATLRWRVEDDVRLLLDRLEIPYEGYELFSDTTYNSRGGFATDVDLETLPEPLCGELRDMTERYGYEWPSR